jgi:hypothetical protein
LVFLINVPLGFLVILMILWKLKGEWAGAGGEKFDLIGSTVYGMAIIALVYAISLLPSAAGSFVILGGLIFLAAFVVIEGRTQSPVLDIRLLRENKTFAFPTLQPF